SLAEFTDLLRQGRTSTVSPVAGVLAAANALYYLHPFAAAESADFALRVSSAGAELRVQTKGPDEAPEPRLVPALDPALVEEGVAALGALDCRKRLGARQRLMIRAWQATGGLGARELGALVDA